MKCQVGCPIRKSLDQSPFPAPQSLSQGITSFIASCCQGIHQTPFSRLIRSRERKAGLLLPRPQACPHPCRPPPDQKSYISPPHPSPEGLRGAAVSVLDLEQSHPRAGGPLGPPRPGPPPTRGAPDGFDVLSSRCHVLIGRESAPRGARRSDDGSQGQQPAQPGQGRWWVEEDSNLRPHAYQACALTT